MAKTKSAIIKEIKEAFDCAHALLARFERIWQQGFTFDTAQFWWELRGSDCCVLMTNWRGDVERVAVCRGENVEKICDVDSVAEYLARLRWVVEQKLEKRGGVR